MKLVRCARKHFFDSDMYDECPHCEEMEAMDKPKPSAPSAPSKSRSTPSDFIALSEEYKRNTSNETEPELRQRRIDDEFSNIGVPSSPPPSPPPSSPPPPARPAAPPPPPPPPPAPQASLQSLVNAAVADKSNAPEDVQTMAFYDFGDAEPVVGWLVCIRGEYIGQSFNLKAGTNFIGRALTMDVPLAKDTKVSRDKHAIIIYEPQKRVFFVQPGESRGLTYMNDELLLAYRPLNKGEKIAVGNSEFIFVPFCGEDFAWEDYFN